MLLISSLYCEVMNYLQAYYFHIKPWYNHYGFSFLFEFSENELDVSLRGNCGNSSISDYAFFYHKRAAQTFWLEFYFHGWHLKYLAERLSSFHTGVKFKGYIFFIKQKYLIQFNECLMEGTSLRTAGRRLLLRLVYSNHNTTTQNTWLKKIRNRTGSSQENPKVSGILCILPYGYKENSRKIKADLILHFYDYENL